MPTAAAFSGARRRRVIVPVVAALLLVVAVLVLWRRSADTSSCSGEPSVAGRQVPRVFDTGASVDHESDPRLRRLVAAVSRMPFGKVIGAVGYDYGQYVSVSGLPDALGVSTKGNPVLGVLGPDLRPAWGIDQSDVQHAYDAGSGRYLALQLTSRGPMLVTAYALADGRRDWCTPVGTVATRYGDPLGTDVLAGGDVLVLANGRHGAATVTRLAARTGHARWTRAVTGADRGDSLVGIGERLAVLGGRPAYELAQPAGHVRGGLVAIDVGTGRSVWSYAPGRPVHVLGATGNGVVLEQGDLTHGLGLVALDDTGRPAWRVRPAAGYFDAALFGHVVVVKTGHDLAGYDASTGRRLWRTPYPSEPQFFPYGFALSSAPFLDADHVLLGTTTAMRSLDLRTGRLTSYPLPSDGINTTYWPYQVVVTARNVAVVTNTGAVVTQRS